MVVTGWFGFRVTVPTCGRLGEEKAHSGNQKGANLSMVTSKAMAIDEIRNHLKSIDPSWFHGIPEDRNLKGTVTGKIHVGGVFLAEVSFEKADFRGFYPLDAAPGDFFVLVNAEKGVYLSGNRVEINRLLARARKAVQ